MIKSLLVFVLVSLAFVLFETSILTNLLFLPSVPDLLLLCSLYVSVNNGKLYGASSGFISGFFLDFLSVSPFGLNCLLRTIIGYVAGIFSKSLNIVGFFIPAFLGILATLVKALLIWFISIFFVNSVNSYNLLSVQFLFELGANAILTPFVFKFLGIFDKMLLLEPGEIK
ncbi:MAG: rod shape-determining protein MreD [Treponema sp.]|nr:rod shape-determining protein MreD [Candidatus Treponema equifaecale]